MKIYSSCKTAIQSCLDAQTFAIAHLYNDEKTMDIHIHDCYEIYYSISGGKQFLIDNRFYDFSPGDLFFINQYENHHLSKIDSVTHERIVLSIYPDYLKKCSTDQTDLNHCFTCRNTAFGHKLSLSAEEQKRFLYYIYKLGEKEDFGQDVLDHALFLELMTFLNRIFHRQSARACKSGVQLVPDSLMMAELSAQSATDLSTQTTPDLSAQSATDLSAQTMPDLSAQSAPELSTASHHTQINEILSYINQNLTEELTLKNLAAHFYLSTSHLCKIFKDTTGTTINRYITAKRITLAKSLLTSGCSVMEACEKCGFRDYSNFLKTFTKAVGISPKKYSQYEH